MNEWLNDFFCVQCGISSPYTIKHPREVHMGKPNLKLKAVIIERFGSQAVAAEEFQINEFRLSRIIHGRAKAKPHEKRTVAWKLQTKISDIFPEG